MTFVEWLVHCYDFSTCPKPFKRMFGDIISVFEPQFGSSTWKCNSEAAHVLGKLDAWRTIERISGPVFHHKSSAVECWGNMGFGPFSQLNVSIRLVSMDGGNSAGSRTLAKHAGIPPTSEPVSCSSVDSYYAVVGVPGKVNQALCQPPSQRFAEPVRTLQLSLSVRTYAILHLTCCVALPISGCKLKPRSY